MRIVSGKWRGHNLFVPNIPDTRPTMDRTRMAIFNILRSNDWADLEDAHVLDVFAGSGAMGFEALSQGAKSAVFFEQHADAVKSIERNAEKLKATKTEAIMYRGDVMKAGQNRGAVATIAFFDPPYKKDLLLPAMQALQAKGWITTDTLLVLEMQKYETPPENVTVHDERVYGTSKVMFANLIIN